MADGKAQHHISRERQEIFRKRLLAARRIASLSQTEASTLLGFRNPSTLSKVESGTAPARFALLIAASGVYGVSLDYLVGLSEYPERDPAVVEQVAAQRAVASLLTEYGNKLAVATVRCHRVASDMRPAAVSLAHTALQASEQFDAFRQSYPAFDEEMRGGSRFARAFEQMVASARAVLAAEARTMATLDQMARQKIEVDPQAPTTAQLFDEQAA